MAIISFVLNFIPGASSIKTALQTVRNAKNLGKAAVKAAMKKAARQAAKDVVDDLKMSAVQNAAKYFKVNGKAIKHKYLEAILDGDEDGTEGGNLVTEVVFAAFGSRHDVKKDVEDFVKKVDPTGVADLITVFNKESCDVMEPLKSVASNSAFDYLPLCLFEGGGGDCTHSNAAVTVR